uniref:ATP synthase subunit delta, chloroplastic n=1 Tax=Corynoplastis japonica TaxID=700918 RepID=A0A1X9PVU5_9RHOD|nr:ATP synthase CF1 subunit delta [Corynoplastis japonica]
MISKNVVAKVAQPYAEALYDLQSLADFLKNPIIANKDKKNLINNIFANSISEIVLNFLMVLVDRGRIAILQNIADKYLELAYQLSDITVAKVTTAIPLSENQEQDLITKLKIMTQSQEVKLMIDVDQELIGGIIIQIGSKVIDNSLKGQIREISTYLHVVN